MIYTVLQTLVGNPDIVPVFSTATWTVRQRATGTLRNVTARSRQEAKDKISNGIFDEDRAPPFERPAIPLLLNRCAVGKLAQRRLR